MCDFNFNKCHHHLLPHGAFLFVPPVWKRNEEFLTYVWHNSVWHNPNAVAMATSNAIDNKPEPAWVLNVTWCGLIFIFCLCCMWVFLKAQNCDKLEELMMPCKINNIVSKTINSPVKICYKCIKSFAWLYFTKCIFIEPFVRFSCAFCALDVKRNGFIQIFHEI